jgi:hypothetical protein
MHEIDRAWDEVWEELDRYYEQFKDGTTETFRVRVLAPDGRVLEVAMKLSPSGYRTVDFTTGP